MKRVTTLENRFEADLVTDALDQEGIEYVVKTFQDTAYDGIFVTQKGYALLLVDENQAGQAELIVEGIRKSVEDQAASTSESADEGEDGEDAPEDFDEIE